MKVQITFDIDIDGEIEDKMIENVFNNYKFPRVITSEDIDGTDDWAILINGYDVELIKD